MCEKPSPNSGYPHCSSPLLLTHMDPKNESMKCRWAGPLPPLLYKPGPGEHPPRRPLPRMPPASVGRETLPWFFSCTRHFV